MYQCKQGMFDDGCERCTSYVPFCKHKDLHQHRHSCDKSPKCIPIKEVKPFLTVKDMEI